MGNISPSAGGCWFCNDRPTDQEHDMVFCWEFDCYVHKACVRKAVEADVKHEDFETSIIHDEIFPDKPSHDWVPPEGFYDDPPEPAAPTYDPPQEEIDVVGERLRAISMCGCGKGEILTDKTHSGNMERLRCSNCGMTTDWVFKDHFWSLKEMWDHNAKLMKNDYIKRHTFAVDTTEPAVGAGWRAPYEAEKRNRVYFEKPFKDCPTVCELNPDIEEATDSTVRLISSAPELLQLARHIAAEYPKTTSGMTAAAILKYVKYG